MNLKKLRLCGFADEADPMLNGQIAALKENESTNMTAGSEGVITYEYEEELD